MNARKEYMDLARYATERAQAAGAAAAEAFVTDSESIQVQVNDRQVEQMNAVREAGIGVRVIKDDKMAFGSTNDLSRDAVRTLAEDLVKKVVHHTADEFNVIPHKEDGFLESDWSGNADLCTYDPKIAEIAVQEKIKVALRMEAAGLSASPKITGSMFAIYYDGTEYKYLANTNGFAGWFRSAACGAAVQMSAAEGDEKESGEFSKTVARYDEFNPEEIGRKAADNAVSMLGAKPVESCETAMVVAPEVGTQLLAYVAGMLSADEVQKGRSLFAGKIGAEVGSAVLTLIDDGRLKGGLATAPVDGEGIPTQTTPLVVDGVLRTYLYDCYCAKKAQARSTGNRTRSDYGSAGRVGTTNLYLKPGSIERNQVFAGIDRGFYLTVVLGLHAAIDSASGDFSIPSAGFLIEKGKIDRPVRGVTVNGNLFEMLKAVEMIGNDLTWFQATGAPTFSVRNVKIGGR